jgi:7-keto-8-aminopelargonate synthetase-like enzyme
MRDFRAALDDLYSASSLRTRRIVSGEQGPVLDVDGNRLVAIASDDYLGLSAHLVTANSSKAASVRRGP